MTNNIPIPELSHKLQSLTIPNVTPTSKNESTYFDGVMMNVGEYLGTSIQTIDSNEILVIDVCHSRDSCELDDLAQSELLLSPWHVVILITKESDYSRWPAMSDTGRKGYHVYLNPDFSYDPEVAQIVMDRFLKDLLRKDYEQMEVQHPRTGLAKFTANDGDFTIRRRRRINYLYWRLRNARMVAEHGYSPHEDLARYIVGLEIGRELIRSESVSIHEVERVLAQMAIRRRHINAMIELAADSKQLLTLDLLRLAEATCNNDTLAKLGVADTDYLADTIGAQTWANVTFEDEEENRY